VVGGEWGGEEMGRGGGEGGGGGGGGGSSITAGGNCDSGRSSDFFPRPPCRPTQRHVCEGQSYF
jgi:hypothetical protein